MRFTAYVAEIDNDTDSLEIDFESTDYCEADAAIVSEDRIRLEWMEGDDEFWAITVDHIYDNGEGEFGTGQLECTYTSWEGRRNIERREVGRVEATIIANDSENEYHELDEFWLDVNWTTDTDSGRLLFELERKQFAG